MKMMLDADDSRGEGTEDDERRLVDAMAAFGIELRILTRHVGPRTITYRVMPAPGVTVSTITRRALDVGVQLSTASCTAREEQGRLFVEVARDDMDIPRFSDLPVPSDPDDLLVGVDGLGVPVHVRLDKLPHCILAGSTGSGKSTAMRVLIRGALRAGNRRVVICDPKGSGDFTEFARGLHEVHSDLGESTTALWKMGDVLDLRMRRKRMTEVTEDVRRFGNSDVLLVLDEVQLVQSKGALAALHRILATGRSMGMNCIIATQHPSALVLGSEMRANCPSRLVFQVSSQSDSRVALGDAGAERLLGSGDGLLRYQGRVTRIQVPSID